MVYLSEVDILALHYAAVGRYGGLAGVRDRAALESCLAQPRTAVFGTERFASAAEKAAAYCFFVAHLHPFHDGNKRTAFLASLHFLRVNGVPAAFDEEIMFRAIMAVARGECNVEELTKVFEEAISKASGKQ